MVFIDGPMASGAQASDWRHRTSQRGSLVPRPGVCEQVLRQLLDADG